MYLTVIVSTTCHLFDRNKQKVNDTAALILSVDNNPEYCTVITVQF